MTEPSNKRESDNAPNFIYDLIDQELRKEGPLKVIRTRFPPEPNGYLHIGHAKAIWINFTAAQRSGQGSFNLRFDDTNPVAEEARYVEAIKRDILWLGFDWQDRLFFASDYFEQLFAWAKQLILVGKAYVDSQSAEQIRENRGSFYKPGVDSPHRERSVEENLDLFERMRNGQFDEGQCVLRAKIDMRSPNLNLRDPLMYRVLKVSHHRTGSAWCIYPMYDWAHGQSDAIEGITHSLCSLEFEDHRPLYDWFLEALELEKKPRQFEFSRLNLTYTTTHKRTLKRLVEEKRVSGWDDPRMPTLSGLRRRGYPSRAIVRFLERVGVAKRDSIVDVALLEHELREELNAQSPRYMAVLNPVKVVIENYPDGQVDSFEAHNHPEYPDRGSHKLPFGRVLYIERDDFREEAPKKWFRLAPGREVRLRYACLITCKEVLKDAAGEVTELRCTWDPDSKGGTPADGRKVRGTLHWVSAEHAVRAEVRLYDRLFSVENPDDVAEGGDITEGLNPDSLKVLKGCRIEPELSALPAGARVQFERLGYFCVDSEDSTREHPVFNRTITLRDTWAKLEQRG